MKECLLGKFGYSCGFCIWHCFCGDDLTPPPNAKLHVMSVCESFITKADFKGCSNLSRGEKPPPQLCGDDQDLMATGRNKQKYGSKTECHQIHTHTIQKSWRTHIWQRAVPSSPAMQFSVCSFWLHSKGMCHSSGWPWRELLQLSSYLLQHSPGSQHQDEVKKNICKTVGQRRH